MGGIVLRNFIIKRVAISVVILLCVTLIIYCLVRAMPGSYVESMAIQLSPKFPFINSQIHPNQPTRNGLSRP